MAANQHKQEGAKKSYLTMVHISVHNKILLIYYMIKMLNERPYVKIYSFPPLVEFGMTVIQIDHVPLVGLNRFHIENYGMLV